MTAVGTIPVPNGPGNTTRTEEFDLAVKSTPIDIALFQPATTQLTKLAGQFSADVRVRGTLESPRVDGLVETSNGGVHLRVPEQYSAHLETGTVNGGLNIDFPLTVQGRLDRQISADLGSGGAPIRVRTHNGGVKISKK